MSITLSRAPWWTCLRRWGNTKANHSLPPVAFVGFVLLVLAVHSRRGGHDWEDKALGSSHLSQVCSIVSSMKTSTFSTLPLMITTYLVYVSGFTDLSITGEHSFQKTLWAWPSWQTRKVCPYLSICPTSPCAWRGAAWNTGSCGTWGWTPHLLASLCGCQSGDRVKAEVFGCHVCSIGLLTAFDLSRGNLHDAVSGLGWSHIHLSLLASQTSSPFSSYRVLKVFTFSLELETTLNFDLVSPCTGQLSIASKTLEIMNIERG